MAQNQSTRLPSLHGVRAFEAAARLGSFKAAAEALYVSPTAISHHVRGLEAEIGVRLFDRHPRRVVLTPSGQKLSTAATASLAGLAQALDEIRDETHLQQVTITAGPFIASRWIIPMLGQLREQFPDTELRLNQILGEIDPATIDAEIILAWGDGNWPGFTCDESFGASGQPPSPVQRLPVLSAGSTMRRALWRCL